MAISNPKKRLAPNREAWYPQLRPEDYIITSEEAPEYNCVAWVSHETERWWWPDSAGLYYWPDAVPRQATLAAFVALYERMGYVVCNDAKYESGFEKIAIYLNDAGVPTHAARQTGKVWTSKLGGCEDIEHNTLEVLEGNPPAYGHVGRLMKKKI